MVAPTYLHAIHPCGPAEARWVPQAQPSHSLNPSCHYTRTVFARAGKVALGTSPVASDLAKALIFLPIIKEDQLPLA